MPFRVVASDLDGTLVRSDGTISERSRQALARAEAAGAMLVVVTGRPIRWLEGIAEQTGHHGIAICSNGAVVWDLAREEALLSHPMHDGAVRQIIDALKAAMPDLGFAVERVQEGFLHERNYKPRWDIGVEPVDDVDALLGSPVVKLLARHEQLTADELLARARAAVGEDLASLTHSSRDGLLEICAPGITKASALAALCAEHDLSADDAIAFGDMPNDLPMLTWARHGVAVANAHPEVLAAVDEVTSSNDDDGVAEVLERVFG